MAACLHIFPSSSLADEKVSIFVDGLEPRQKISIRAKRDEWVSEASFAADEMGTVRLDRDAPLFGSYQKIDPMGLFWSMNSSVSSGSYRRSQTLIHLHLLIDGRLADCKEIERHLLKPDVIRTDIRENGLAGTLFTPSSKTSAAIIVLGGSSGGLAENRAQMLSNHGFAALALAYFGHPGLPDHLAEIPLEYFERAINYLKQRYLSVSLYGISRGGELALLIASYFPDKIDALAAIVPSSVVQEGFPTRGKSSWTLHNTPLPYAPFQERKWGAEEGKTAETAIRLTPLFYQGMDCESYQRAAIPVEQIRCPVLLISGSDDQMWPSAAFAAQAAARIKAPCTHLCYEGAGHHISYPYQPICTKDYHRIAKAWFDFGGTSEKGAYASEDSWARLLYFFSMQLQV